MKNLKLLFFLFIIFPFTSISNPEILEKNIQNETEASFSFDCPDCEKINKLPIELKNLKCLQTIHSKECRQIPEKDRKTCTNKDDLKISDTGSFLYQCVKETASSFWFVFDLLWYAITASTSWMFEEGEDKSSSQNYIYVEFSKVYAKAKGSKLERALKAAEIVGKEAFNLMYSHIAEFLKTEYKVLKCYNDKTHATLGCVFALGLLIPIPGASFLSMAKPAGKIGSKFIKKPKTTINKFKRTMQIKNIKAHIDSKYDVIKKNILKKSQKLSKTQRNQILKFFKSIDKKKLTNLITNKLKNVKKETISRENIKNAIIASLTVGTVHAIQLSPKMVNFVGEEFIDHIAPEYFYKEVL